MVDAYRTSALLPMGHSVLSLLAIDFSSSIDLSVSAQCLDCVRNDHLKEWFHTTPLDAQEARDSSIC
jgi:hypothetical protein